jgi:hypothetical protein
VLAWPVAGADLVALSNDADGALTRLREFGTDSKERPALPEVTATLRVLTVAPERAVGVKPAARLLGVTEGEVARARDAGRLGEVVAIHHGKLRMSLDREEIEELSEKRLDRISRHAAGELLGIPAYGVEQLVVSGHLDVQRHSWLLDRHGAPVLLRRDVEALRDRIVAASFGAVTNPVTLSVAAKAFGGGPKPWAMIVCMLLAGRLDCAAAVESDGSLRIVVSAAAIPLVASLPVGAGRPIYSQLEAVEVLNLTAKHAAVLTDLRLAADVGSRNGWRLDGEAVDVIASSRASMAELMSRSCASQKTVASHLARCGVLPLDGFGFDRARALKVLADWIEAGSPKPCRRRSRRGVEHAAAGRMA